MCELRWLKDETVVEVRNFHSFNEAQRDIHQLSLFYRARFGVTRAEVWDDHGLKLFRGI